MKTPRTKTAGERTQGLIEGIEDLFKMMDEGILVRDISRDGDADFYKRNLDFVMRMATVKQALDDAKLIAMPVCGACGRNYRRDEFSKGEYCQTCQPGNLRMAASDEEAISLNRMLHMRAALQLAYDNSCARSETNRKWTQKDQDAHEAMKLALDGTSKVFNFPAGKLKEFCLKDTLGKAHRSSAQILIDTINATGGIGRDLSPAADSDWIDLGFAYVKACEELGLEPKYDGVIGVYDPVGGAMNECSKCHDMVKKIIVCSDAQLCEACFGKTEVATII